ncbi:MAG: DNA-3-methyladenine glycosylase [Nitrospinae bacterium]|nr:DNA-3-methyladenine glycosylase [Nitrospinota bacterium]
MKLPHGFYEQPTVTVAQQLLGKYLVRGHPQGGTAGKIVETEAYVGPDDKASHASKGRTPRTTIMFGPAGYAYVYLIYGFHHCFNIVTEMQGYPAAVLIRAVEPVEGIELMRARRRTHDARNLTNGPGKVCQAFAIDRSFNGADVCGDVLFVEDRGDSPPAIVLTTRVGVEFAGPWKDKPWRFYIRGHAAVSRR